MLALGQGAGFLARPEASPRPLALEPPPTVWRPATNGLSERQPWGFAPLAAGVASAGAAAAAAAAATAAARRRALGTAALRDGAFLRRRLLAAACAKSSRPRPPAHGGVSLGAGAAAAHAPGAGDDTDDDLRMGPAQEMSLILREVTQRNTVKTIIKVAMWSGIAMTLSFLLFSAVQRKVFWLFFNEHRVVPLSDAATSYVGNFLSLTSLLFSILAGGSYAALYSQNEAIFYALFAEVSEAKALMEQVALVCSGRPFYRSVLEYIKAYVDRDLRRLDRPPAVLCGRKPRDDPLEGILYLTSVGVPSVVYETVRSLRQKRGDRLGAVQRKLPAIQMVLLYMLGALTLLSFLLFASSVVGGERLLCRALFALLAGALVMTLRVIHELWNPVGGAYNVDGVLAIMVRGLEAELQQRLQGRAFSDTRLPSPPPRWQANSRSAPAVNTGGAEASAADSTTK